MLIMQHKKTKKVKGVRVGVKKAAGFKFSTFIGHFPLT